MDNLLKGAKPGAISEGVLEESNENIVENEESASSKKTPPPKNIDEDRKDSFVVNVNMQNLDNSSNIGVNIAINEASLSNPTHRINSASQRSNEEEEKSIHSNKGNLIETPKDKNENLEKEEEDKKLYELNINKESKSNSNNEEEEEGESENESESQSQSQSNSQINEIRQSQYVMVLIINGKILILDQRKMIILLRKMKIMMLN